MPTDITIEIENLDIIQNMANKYPRVARRHIDNAIVRSIGEIDRQTKPLTPVKTGRLRSSMLPQFAPFQGTYGSKLSYAVEVHDKYKAGMPYKRPSLNKRAVAGFLTIGIKKSERIANKVFVEALDKIVDDLSKK